MRNEEDCVCSVPNCCDTEQRSNTGFGSEWDILYKQDGHYRYNITMRHSCPILMKLELSGQISTKYSYIKVHENLSNGSQVVPCGQT